MEKQQQGQRSTPREGEGEVVRDGGPTLGTVSGERLALATPGRETRGRPTTPSEPRLTLRRCARGALSSSQLPVQSAMSWPP